MEITLSINNTVVRVFAADVRPSYVRSQPLQALLSTMFILLLLHTLHYYNWILRFFTTVKCKFLLTIISILVNTYFTNINIKLG